MGVAYLGGPQAWQQLTQYSSNPFLNAIQDLMPLMKLFTNYMQYKPFIDQYSNTSLSDIAPIVKQYLPDVVNKKGQIDYKKLQKYLTDTKDPMKQQIASQVFNIAKTRYQFTNAPFQWQMQALTNPTFATILNGQQILTKTINTMQNVKQLNQTIDKLQLPDSLKTLLKQSAPKLVSNPAMLGLLMPYLSQMTKSTPQPTTAQPTPSILQPLNPTPSILQPLNTPAPSVQNGGDPLELDTYNYEGA
jgi:hypothetical protein